MAIEHTSRGQGYIAGVAHDRLDPRGCCKRVRVCLADDQRIRLRRQDRIGAQIDVRRFGRLPDAIPARLVKLLAPCSLVGGGEDGALGDQFGFSLLDQRVLIDAQEHRGDARQNGDEDQCAKQDSAEAQRGPVALGEFLEAPDERDRGHNDSLHRHSRESGNPAASSQ